MKRATFSLSSRLHTLIFIDVPAFDWTSHKKEWKERKDRILILDEAKDDLRDRDADLKTMSTRATPLLTVSTVLLAAYGLQQDGFVSGWVAQLGIILTATAIVTVLWSNMPPLRVWKETFKDAGDWVFGVNDEYDRLARIVYKIHVRNHILTKIRRLHTISYILIILSVIVTSISFIL